MRNTSPMAALSAGALCVMVGWLSTLAVMAAIHP